MEKFVSLMQSLEELRVTCFMGMVVLEHIL